MEYLRPIGLILHVFGFTMWIANIFANFQMLTSWSTNQNAQRREGIMDLCKETIKVMDLGLGITLVGAGLLLAPLFSFYLTQKWLYVKLPLALLLVYFHAFIRGRYASALAGQEFTVPAPMMILVRVSFIGILVMVLAKPF